MKTFPVRRAFGRARAKWRQINADPGMPYADIPFPERRKPGQ
jgi:hypothetical protein